jgi:hypothetical protein
MSKKKSSVKSEPRQLLVEGSDDLHVIRALRGRYKISEELFSVKIPSDLASFQKENKDEGGKELLLKNLPRKLKESNLETLGVILDADEDLQASWESVRDKLIGFGYQNIPKYPLPEGWIYSQPEFPKIGVWLMPNNQLPGMLEDFVQSLIPENDLLFPKAEQIIQEIETENLHKYKLSYRAKALIYTWLAWQKKPGKPMGQSITARVLQADTAIAAKFVIWLNQLLNPIDQ